MKAWLLLGFTKVVLASMLLYPPLSNNFTGMILTMNLILLIGLAFSFAIYNFGLRKYRLTPTPSLAMKLLAALSGDAILIFICLAVLMSYKPAPSVLRDDALMLFMAIFLFFGNIVQKGYEKLFSAIMRSKHH